MFLFLLHVFQIVWDYSNWVSLIRLEKAGPVWQGVKIQPTDHVMLLAWF